MQYHTSNQEGGQITYCRCVFSKNLWVNRSMFGFFVYTHVSQYKNSKNVFIHIIPV